MVIVLIVAIVPVVLSFFILKIVLKCFKRSQILSWLKELVYYLIFYNIAIRLLLQTLLDMLIMSIYTINTGFLNYSSRRTLESASNPNIPSLWEIYNLIFIYFYLAAFFIITFFLGKHILKSKGPSEINKGISDIHGGIKPKKAKIMVHLTLFIGQRVGLAFIIGFLST